MTLTGLLREESSSLAVYIFRLPKAFSDILMQMFYAMQ